MIAQTLQQKIGEAMKAHDEVKLSTLRLLSSAFNYEKIAKQHDLDDSEELVVIRREAKQRKDSVEAYKKAGAMDLAAKEEAELVILQEYLPPEMDEKELTKIVIEVVAQTGAKTMADIGKVMGMVKSKAPEADGGRVAGIIKKELGI
jgi:uncharacterized protein YqeY